MHNRIRRSEAKPIIFSCEKREFHLFLSKVLNMRQKPIYYRVIDYGYMGGCTLARRRRIKKRIFDYIISHQGEQYSIYKVSQYAKCEAHTAKRYHDEIIKALVDTKVQIVEKTIESLETQKGITIWQKLKRAIVAHILSQKQTQN